MTGPMEIEKAKSFFSLYLFPVFTLNFTLKFIFSKL